MKFYTYVKAQGNQLLVKEIDNGKRVIKRVSYVPTLFRGCEEKNTLWRTMSGAPVKTVRKNSLYDAYSYLKQNRDVDGIDVYGPPNFESQYIIENYDGRFDIALINIYGCDIETEIGEGFPHPDKVEERVQLITLGNIKTRTSTTFGLHPYTGKSVTNYVHCRDEETLLSLFLEAWEEADIDVITGWHTDGFDLPYLVNRLAKILGPDAPKRLSPFRLLKKIEKDKFGANEDSYDIIGISRLDYIKLDRKQTIGSRESYALDYVAEAELGERKIENPYPTMKDFYLNDWNLFVEYNVRDYDLIVRLEDKKKLIELWINMAYKAGTQYEDIFYPGRMWDNIIYRYLHRQNIVIPPKTEPDAFGSYEGAYVKDPVPGLHRWVASFDLKSQYPHTMMQYNISPETLTDVRLEGCNVPDLVAMKFDTSPAKEKDLALTANGWCYRRDKKGVLPAMMEELYAERDEHKRHMLALEQEYENDKSKTHLLKEIARLDILQYAIKIALVSAYGSLANYYFRYYDVRLASSVTLSAQVSIRFIADRLNVFMNQAMKTEDVDYIIYIDTDSVYLNMEPIVEKFASDRDDKGKIEYMDDACETVITPFIDRQYKELAEYMNAAEQKMSMKREVLCDRVLFTAKKRYILQVLNSENVQYAEPQIKATGLENVRSTTPAVVRKKMLDLYPVILSGERQAFHDFVMNFQEEFNNLSIEEIACSIGVSDMEKWMRNAVALYNSGTPIHVKGAIIYNNQINKLKLDGKYREIKSGDKVKYVYLKKGNPLGEHVISFHNVFPPEFLQSVLRDYHIDRDRQFKRVFEDPIQHIVTTLGWDVKVTNTLEEFFG